MRRLPWWGAVLAVVVLTGLLYLPITGIVWPREGHTFAAEGSAGWGNKVGPGQEWVHIYDLQQNEARGSVEVERIIPEGIRHMPGVAKILDIKIAPRIPGQPAVIAGTAGIARDADMSDCPNQKLYDPKGYVVPQGAMVMLAVRYRAQGIGHAYVDRFRIDYKEGNIQRRSHTVETQEITVLDKPKFELHDRWSKLCNGPLNGADAFMVTDIWD